MPNAITSSHLAESGRLQWPDLAKGIAIILVVVGHVLGGLMAGGFIPEEPNGRWLHQWLYLFHIPTFFFVSGWLVEFRSSRTGLIQMKPLAASLLYPYFLWGTIIWAVHWLADSGGITNLPVDPWAPLRLFYAASSGPWFLLILFLLHSLNWALGSCSNRTGLRCPEWVSQVAAAKAEW